MTAGVLSSPAAAFAEPLAAAETAFVTAGTSADICVAAAGAAGDLPAAAEAPFVVAGVSVSEAGL